MAFSITESKYTTNCRQWKQLVDFSEIVKVKIEALYSVDITDDSQRYV